MAENNTNSKKKRIPSVKDTPIILMLPLMAVLGIVPLIVFLYSYDCGLEYYDFFQTPEDYETLGGSVDFFLYWKMLTFCILAALMAIIIVFKLVMEKKRIKFSKVFIPLGVYGLLAVLSSVVSQHKPYPFTGIYEQFEPLWALLGYCLVAYYAYLYVNTEKDIEKIVAALVFSTVLILLIGLTQAFFTDFYQSEIGARMILPADYYKENGTGGLVFNFEKGRVYLTVYNPNYVGSYVALLMPLFLMLVFATKRVYMKVVYAVIAVSLILVLLGSQSRAGFVGVFASLILMVVVFNKKLLKKWVPVVITAVVIVGIVVGYDVYTGGLIRNKIKAAFNPAQQSFDLSRIDTLDDEVIMTYKDNRLHMQFNYNNGDGTFSIACYDDDYNAVESYVEEDGITFVMTDDRFEGTKVNPVGIDENTVGFEVDMAGRAWYFVNDGTTYYMLSSYGKLIKSVNSDSVKWLEERAGFASGRGFIWGKTIPLLKDHILLGSGADTFVIEFPNYDFLAMYNGGYDGQIMTKPHNMYLQMGVQTGVLSVIAFLVYYAWFFFYGLFTAFRTRELNYTAYAGIGILTGSFGYMVVQIINDSSITVAPLYWVLTGVGIAAFTTIRKSDIYVSKVSKEA